MKHRRKDWAELDPFDLVREHDVADRWDVSPRTLQRWRALKYGPAFVVIGGGPRYRVGDVLAFEAQQRRGGVE